MNEAEFEALADKVLWHIENQLENCGAELDIEQKPEGVLEIEFENGSRMIINRHRAAREIWVAARSGGFHFRPGADGCWISQRENAEMYDFLSRLVSDQAGVAVRLQPKP